MKKNIFVKVGLGKSVVEAGRMKGLGTFFFQLLEELDILAQEETDRSLE